MPRRPKQPRRRRTNPNSCLASFGVPGLLADAPHYGAEAGRGDRIRTCDPLLPKQMRYQAAPLPDDSAPKADRDVRQSPGTGGSPRWWARQDSNLQPSRYERPALPLSYRPSPDRREIDKALAPRQGATGLRQGRENSNAKASRLLTRSPPAIRARPRASRSEKPPFEPLPARRFEQLGIGDPPAAPRGG